MDQDITSFGVICCFHFVRPFEVVCLYRSGFILRTPFHTRPHFKGVVVYPCLVTSTNPLQKCIPFSFISNRKSLISTLWNFSSLNTLNGFQNAGNPSCRHFLVRQLIFNNWLHTAMAYADFLIHFINCYTGHL